MQTKIAFTSYPVSDLDRAVKFYQKVLGMKPLFHREDWAEFDLGGQKLALQKVSSPISLVSSAVVYFLAQPIEGFVFRLKEMDISLLGSIEVHSYGKLARFKDPDGNILGLYDPLK
jgi:catechol 2,3-dioxygenase-like lactoylglutathione lyase family enzyme